MKVRQHVDEEVEQVAHSDAQETQEDAMAEKHPVDETRRERVRPGRARGGGGG